MPLLVASAALAALLSFSLEPMVGRMVLPHFGGAVHVWALCLTVFQGSLLLAYAWAHVVAPRLGGWHLAALAFGALWLPIDLGGSAGGDAPALLLVLRLVAGVAVPFAALSTTAVVLQSWLAATDLEHAADPYPLYGASNLGSLLGLLAYPLLIEPFVGLEVQRLAWAGGYLVWLGVSGVAWAVLRPRPVPGPLAIRGSDAARWALLAAGPSALLAAVTHLVANEIGSFPLVWAIPLALYLGSFVLAFRHVPDRGKARTYWPHSLLALFPLTVEHVVRPWAIGLLYAAFLAVCFLFHRALYDTRPRVERLTGFYLAVALGGWLGGLAVSVGAPLSLAGPWDGPLVIGAMALIARWALGDPLGLFRPPAVFGVIGIPVAVFVLMDQAYVARYRSFYGLFAIEERVVEGVDPHRRLVHGTTVHGMQYLDPAREPVAYHHRGGPLHEAWEQRRGGRTAVLGLGAGTMAFWIRPDESLVFYEIDPGNEAIARRWFTWLERARGPVEVRVGDARLRMLHEVDRAPYDVILLDAFAGDAIPTHLVTVEAFRTWASRTAPDGLLVWNLSSRYVDLRPIVARVAEEVGWTCVARFGVAAPEVFDDPLAAPTSAMACAARPERLGELEARGWSRFEGGPAPPFTDDWNPALRLLWP